ncbi:hypothetical protein N8Z90_01040 [Crocinitomicaceae bacterium]|nr:hypothetical protein [Crocinitomicaceae bacterium]
MSGRLVVSNKASGYKYIDQKINIYVSINPYSIKDGNTVRLKDYCFLQKANSWDGLTWYVTDIKVKWNKTAAQLAKEKREKREQEKAAAAYKNMMKKQAEEAKKIKLMDQGLLSKAQLFLENGEYANALAMVKQTSDYTYFTYADADDEYYYEYYELVNDCISKLKDQYGDQYEVLIEEEISAIINKNQTLLASLPKKKYSFIIDYEGNIICTDSSTLKLRNSEPAIAKKFLLIEEFYKIPIKSKFDLDIMLAEEGKFVNPDSIIFHMNPKYASKTIKTNNNKYFLSGFGSPFSSTEVPLARYVTDSTVTDLQVPIYKTTEYDIICNGNTIGSEIKTEKTDEITVLKGTGRKVFRIITAPIWVPLAIAVGILTLLV